MKTASYHFLTRMAFAILAISQTLPINSQNSETLGQLPLERQVISTSSYGAGYKGALDTYLTNAGYSGLSLQFSQSQTTAMYQKKYFSYHDSRNSISYSSMTNSLGGGSMIGAQWNFRYSWEHMFLHTQSVDILAGPAFISSTGFLWNMSNSNNPAQFKMLLSAGVSGKATYRFKLLKRYMAISADVSIPVLGTTFAPNYDEPYYFMAAYTGLGNAFRITDPYNAPAIYSDIALTLPAGRYNRIALTYNADYTGYDMGGHRSAIANHTVLIGFTHRIELKKD